MFERRIGVRSSASLRISFWLALAVVLIPAFAQAQAVIKVNDNVNVKFGGLLQTWADSQEDAATGDAMNNLFVRRIRFLVGGQISPNVSFFFETDNPNLGKTPKALGSGFITQDAYINWKPKGSNAFMLDAGLMLVPMCRNCLNSAGTLLALDYGSYSFTENAATQSSVGRDTGFQARGYLAGGHLEYRAALLQGFRQTASPGHAAASNSLRTMGRLQYNFLDTEVGGFFYPGFYMGNKRIAALGVGVDSQDNYDAYSVDAFFSIPNAAKKNALNADVQLLGFDGGTTFSTIPEQRDVMLQAGYYLGGPKVMPFLRVERQDFRANANNGKDNNRLQAGVGFFPNGHNFNIKGAYTRVDPRVGDSTNEFTIQLQFFYF
jgi:hypothetical protein